MRIHVKYYATYSDLAGKKEEAIEVNAESSLAELVSLLRDRYPRMADGKNIFLLNGKFAKEESALSEEDSVSLFPPIAGG